MAKKTAAVKRRLRSFSLGAFLPYRLSVTTNLVSAVIARAYDGRFGLKVTEWRVIAALAELGKTSQQALSAATRMDKMTVSRATGGLTERGLVARASTPDDGRAYLVSLTPGGRRLYDQIVPDVIALETRLFSVLETRERDDLTHLLERIEASALQMLAGP